MSKNILIIGGAGFAGAGLTSRLLDAGHRVTVLDMAAKPYTPLADTGVAYLWKSAQDLHPRDVEGRDAVLYFAAQADAPMGFTSPRWTVANNIGCLVSVLEAVKDAGCGTFVLAGSGNAVGRPLYLPIDEAHPLTPHNPYAFTKAAQEMACWTYHRAYGVPAVVMSNGMVVGPGMRREIVIFKWLYRALRGEPVYLEGGEQTRDITYVDDVLDAWALCVEAEPSRTAGEKFQVSYGRELSMLEILEICREASGVEWTVERRPYRPGEEGQRERFDTSKARKVLGYEPQVPPAEAIRRTWAWIRDTFPPR